MGAEQFESTSGSSHSRHTALEELGHALAGMRRVVMSTPLPAVPVPELPRAVGLAKILACEAIESLSHECAPTVKDVAAALSLEASSASRLVSECEDEGLVARSPHPTDGRRMVLTLTSGGAAAIRAAAQTRGLFLDRLLTQWSPADIAELAGLLERFASTWRDRRGELLADFG